MFCGKRDSETAALVRRKSGMNKENRQEKSANKATDTI